MFKFGDKVKHKLNPDWGTGLVIRQRPNGNFDVYWSKCDEVSNDYLQDGRGSVKDKEPRLERTGYFKLTQVPLIPIPWYKRLFKRGK